MFLSVCFCRNDRTRQSILVKPHFCPFFQTLFFLFQHLFVYFNISESIEPKPQSDMWARPWTVAKTGELFLMSCMLELKLRNSGIKFELKIVWWPFYLLFWDCVRTHDQGFMVVFHEMSNTLFISWGRGQGWAEGDSKTSQPSTHVCYKSHVADTLIGDPPWRKILAIVLNIQNYIKMSLKTFELMHLESLRDPLLVCLLELKQTCLLAVIGTA